MLVDTFLHKLCIAESHSCSLRSFHSLIPRLPTIGSVSLYCRSIAVLDTALLQWISEYSVQAHTTADSAVLYLHQAQIA